MSYIITNHAVEQYIKRWAPTKSFDEAKLDVENLLKYSKPDGKTLCGDKITSIGDIRFVIKDKNVCITVLPFHNSISINQEEMDLIYEIYKETRFNKINYLEEEILKQKAELDQAMDDRINLAKRIHDMHNNLDQLKRNLANIKEELL